MEDIFFVLNEIAQTIFDKKGFNILALDVRGVSSLCDFLVIAEAHVDRHSAAIAQAVIDELEALNIKPIHVEGMMQGDWVVIDYLNIVIHIFMPNLREKYKLEQIFKEGKIVELNIKVESGSR
ncbi:MAG: ribosome silencing factor [Chlamydiae bacterium]|nr:ribosome silencing factor [Chlamydiota bacterium]